MVRPCFLVVDREFPGSISTRKLVIETAKFNVITAYSGQEAVDTLKAFPAIHGVVLDSAIDDIPCDTLTKTFRILVPGRPIIAICGPGDPRCPGADHELETFDPRSLLELLRSILKSETDKIEEHEEALWRETL